MDAVMTYIVAAIILGACVVGGANLIVNASVSPVTWESQEERPPARLATSETR